MRRLFRHLRALRIYWGWFWQNPAAFVQGLPWDWPRAFFTAEFVVLTFFVQLLDVRLWIEKWRGPTRLEGPFDGASTTLTIGRHGTSWLRTELDEGAALLLVTGEEGSVQSASYAAASNPGLLSLITPAERARVYALEGAPRRVQLRAIGRWDLYRHWRAAGQSAGEALMRAWPTAEQPFQAMPTPDYHTWLAANSRVAPKPDLGVGKASGPLLSIVMPVYEPDPGYWEAALHSVLAQKCDAWELVIVFDGPPAASLTELKAGFEFNPRIRMEALELRGGISAATNRALDLASADVVLFMDHDDLLAPQAVERLITAFEDPEIVAIYSDEDAIDHRGVRSAPVFKSAFDYHRLLAQNYVNHAFAVRTSVARQVRLRPECDGAQDHDFVLRLTEVAPRSSIRHLPEVLYHWRVYPGGSNFTRREPERAAKARLRAVSDHLSRRGLLAEITPDDSGYIKVRPDLPAPLPKVCALIPTRNGGDLLHACVSSLLGLTGYGALEVIIIDNGSTDPKTLRTLAHWARDDRVRVLARPGPFNFSTINNDAALHTEADLLLFLNDDVLAIDQSWLGEMVGWALEPTVGAVGAKLYYPDGRLQHVGVTLGLGPLGVAGHDFRGMPGNFSGPQHRLHVVREASAVTAACLLVERRKFAAVEGFDPSLAVAFNDVDLCLKLERNGWGSVWTPHAQLIHVESASRGRDLSPRAAARLATEARLMRERWGARLSQDPFYHPALTREDESCSVVTMPVVPQPR